MPEPRHQERLHSNVTDTALIFEGGGMRGSYTAGAVTTLLGAGIHIDWVGGISAGATHTANYLTRDAARARRTFVEFSRDPQFGNLRTFARGQGLFNAEYIYEHASLPDASLPFDYGTFQANPARYRIGAFNASTGEQVYFSRADLHSQADLMTQVRASSSMPVLMPPVHYRGSVWVDGALGPTGGIAIDAARADGYEKFLVILTRERDYIKQGERFAAIYRRRFRDHPAVVEALDARPANYNRTREELYDLQESGQAMIFTPDRMPVSNGERRLPRLQAAYAAGYLQAQRELPRWKEFLGI
ncbi:patatin family protein [Kocuria coralli]|uniref:Patatin family protein n=1 Tax=Kocuria coralli TaxID=1461025 RepID=A0A5J5KZY9_9MICC|nr:patatin family protein [Kocuria coralli]KAA9394930.1 patatin family protein [Kocuria coralli]